MIFTLKKDAIDNLFEIFEHQKDVLEAIYRTVVPDWENAVSMDGWPTINSRTHEYIMGKFMAFDRKHHPDVMAGGIWFNSGFSTLANDHLEEWQVDMSECKITYKKKEKAA